MQERGICWLNKLNLCITGLAGIGLCSIMLLAIITFWFQKIFQQVQGAERFKSKSFKRKESLITKIFKSRSARRNGKGTATDKRSKLPLNLNGQQQRKIRRKIKMRW